MSERGLTMEPMYEGEPILARRRGRRADGGRSDREDRDRVRAAAVRGRSDREPAAGQPERARRRATSGCVPPAPAAGAAVEAQTAAGAAAGAAAPADGCGCRCGTCAARGSAAAGSPAAPAAAGAAARRGCRSGSRRSWRGPRRSWRRCGARGSTPSRGQGAEVDRRRLRRRRRGPAAARQAHRRVGRSAIVDAGFKDAALVLDETFVGQNTSHQVLEPRTAMAYWQNGKLYLHAGTQSTVQTVPSIARWVGIAAARTSCSSASTPAAASAAAFPATSRWRFRRCCRRRPTRR